VTNFLDQNEHGQYWDGKNWRNPDDNDDVRVHSIVSDHERCNCHFDGCFVCPRCRKNHFIPDNFDLLCDACAEIVLFHPNASDDFRNNIITWREKAQNHYSGKLDSDILERMKIRNNS
jgi:hypothetical protein